MKKFILLSVFVFALFGIFKQVNAQCPTGWSSGFLEIQDAGCTYYIDFCYQCTPTGYDPSNVQIITILSNCSTINQQLLEDKMRQKLGELCTIPACPGNPCLEIVIDWPLCYQWHQKRWLDENEELQYYNWLESCPGTICQKTNYICIDYPTGDIIECQPSTGDQIGDSCPIIAIIPPPIGIGVIEDEVIGECFQPNTISCP